MSTTTRALAVVTGASTGIGLELARLCAANYFDLVIAADESRIEDVALELSRHGVECLPVQCDLATAAGVEELLAAIDTCARPVDALLANAGRGLGHAFLDQDIEQALGVVHTNIDGTVYLVHRVGRQMRDRGEGRILITGSIAGLMPGTFQAVYNGSKAFLDSFSVALNSELAGSGVTVTCLMPGATETEFFERADMMDTKLGTEKKADAAVVAKLGFDAMLNGDAKVIAGAGNKMRAAISRIVPDTTLARVQKKTAAPGTAKSRRERKERPAR